MGNHWLEDCPELSARTAWESQHPIVHPPGSQSYLEDAKEKGGQLCILVNQRVTSDCYLKKKFMNKPCFVIKKKKTMFPERINGWNFAA